MATITIPSIGTVKLSDPIPGTENFTWGEATHRGERIPTAAHAQNIISLARRMQPYRRRSGRAWIISSWYRPEPWNTRAGGVPNSTHLTGMGVDFVVDQDWGSIRAILSDWPGGFGIYPNSTGHIHLDIGPYARWIK